ncbi:hypothetical protein JCM24511_01313 [Saitozyma sp. JCM 24511]|nr:hypothetical protein JCM24511_01313 [Saitozyma sp. JCM 24511]
MTTPQQPLAAPQTGVGEPTAQSQIPAAAPAQSTDPTVASAGHSGFLSPALLAHIKSSRSVTSELAAAPPDTAVSQVAESLYGKPHHVHHRASKDEQLEHDSATGTESKGIGKLLEKLHLRKASTDESVRDETGQKDKDRKNPAADQWEAMRLLTQTELDEIRGCGQWGGSKPGELFLNIYAQALLTMEDNPINGLVSPPLAGATGVVPLSIISVIPDIIEHHADIIVRAEHEVFLATNFWEASGSAQTIVDAMKELSRRVIERKGKKIVFKLMYDRGNPSQVINPHQAVDVKTYTGDKVKLPAPEEIPGIELEVQNYHVPPVGTFHAKYMVVDRKIAILNSNNIQDRVNVEMMTHIEGPIVQSFYDLALLSWSSAFHPPLPLLASPPSYPSPLTKDSFHFGQAHPLVSTKGDLESNAIKARQTLAEHHASTEQANDGQSMVPKKEVWDADDTAEADRVDDQFGSADAITQHLNTGTKIEGTDKNAPANAAAFTPVILHSPHDPLPMALVNRAPRGKPGHGDTFVPQDQAFLAGFKFAKKSVFVQTPTFNATPVVEAALDAVRRGVLVEIYADLGFNDEGELLPFQGGTNEMVASYMYDHLTQSEKEKLKIYWYTGKDQLTPLNAKDKSRNCHVKLMLADSELIIQGNGNQDTQSWFHSQEVNVLIDSPLLAGEIRSAIDANQNTKFYGLVDPKDGIWRDKEGKELAGQKPPPKGPLKSLVGVKGAIQRVRGEGGF